ncbi:hypothetical protein GXP67_23860 [Rhodocytophaga rosea]|uniref:Uncharacterized protein n=1 Tax=Rhodocytophaga rosea TaxID=2704465 RepID=A0A6C0GN35_9BACT|nr:hypothetical protein [Rhodocytophaga rosea]QHT69461.1 hypothetical protein GXP67_23860 [Rhodocytophaga rosea]
MKIINEYKTHWIELEKSEEENYYYLSVGISVQIKTKQLNCFFETIWIEQDQIDSFITALQALDEKRVGKVELKGMSPDAFSLSIQAIDERGHLAVGICIESPIYIVAGMKERVLTGFEIDPTSIPEIITGLKKIKN